MPTELNLRALVHGPARDPYGLGELPSLTRRMDEWYAEYGAGHTVRGKSPGAQSLILASNDYLSLAADRRIIDAQVEELRAAGSSVFMSSVYTQHLDRQREYELAMAAFLGSEDTVLCQSGWAANDGLVQTLADADTPVYIDLKAHASLWQGIHSAGARARGFRHNSLDSLQGLLGRFGPGIILVDAVYSTNGELCPLAEMVELAEESGSILVVDESHSIGVCGEAGEGLVAALGLTDRVQFRTFSLSKALVGRGGMVAGSARALQYFRYVSRPAIFSSAVLPHEIAGFLRTLELVRSEGWRRAALTRNAALLRERLAGLGHGGVGWDSPIVALECGPEARTRLLRDALEARDVFGAVFCAPATPKQRSLIRLTLNAGLSEAEVLQVAEVCAELRPLWRS